MLRWILRLSLVSALVSAAWFFFPFLSGAETQVQKQHAKLLEFAERRKWPQFYLLLASDYRDSWGQSRDEALSAAHEALAGFLTVGIEWKQHDISRDGKTITLTGAIHLSGTGPASSFAVDYVNKLQKSWVFVWRKDGWTPADWHLISVANPDVAF